MRISRTDKWGMKWAIEEIFPVESDKAAYLCTSLTNRTLFITENKFHSWVLNGFEDEKATHIINTFDRI